MVRQPVPGFVYNATDIIHPHFPVHDVAKPTRPAHRANGHEIGSRYAVVVTQQPDGPPLANVGDENVGHAP